jgi:hypothetical protein
VIPLIGVQSLWAYEKSRLDQVCKGAPLNSSKTELSGNAKLGFDGLLQRLGFTAGVSGDVNQVTTAGVPQEHLAASIRNGNDCRLEMNRMFMNNIISPSPSMRLNPTQPRPRVQGTEKTVFAWEPEGEDRSGSSIWSARADAHHP